MSKHSAPKHKFREVQIVLWRVLAFNVLVALLKIGAGFFSGALSMVADGVHSLMDGASNVVGLVALRVAQAPPDADHPYGHRKAETLASLFIGVLLAIAAYEILSSALGRLWASSSPQVTAISFAVMLATICINLLTTVYEQRRGKALKSEILLADAAHTRSDVWVSLSVLAGLVGVRLGWLWLDAAVGLVIAGVIGYSAFTVLWQSMQVLMDRAALPQGEIEQLALALPGVESVERVRSRGRADETYIDLHVRVRPDTPVDVAHSIAHAVQDRIKAAFPQARDVTIHIEPQRVRQPDEGDVDRQLQVIAASLNASVHDIWMIEVEGRYYVELHLEVPASMTLLEAHELATQFERRGQDALSSVAAVTTHIEPMGEMIEVAPNLNDTTANRMTARARRVAAAICGPDACHAFRLWPEADALALSMHCTLPPAMSIVEAHTISESLKDALRQELPQLKRVMVHVEPPT